ncbi:upstream activation factor subunit spp27-like [Pecten maximus]|uniref:upstream activation factor subunit spp27-like n=1 Tax=Pecten maximus TaxID=6579 RepID=UPI00145864CA|nr:upstream activation factor subunit spp27-like [Pecten maximus]
MAKLSSKEMRAAVKEMLKGADLSTLSAKKIRLKLQEKFDTDLSERKKEVDAIVMELLDEEEAEEDGKNNGKEEEKEQEPEEEKIGEEEEEEEEEEEPPKKRPKSQRQIENESLGEVTDGMDDEEIARQLQEEETGPRRSSRTPKRPPKPSKRSKESRGDGERKGKGYGKPCLLSPALADIMGTDQMPRCDVVKKIYEIAKESSLLDPKNKQYMICNDDLFRVFGKRRVRMFGMMKHLTDHITDPHKIDKS